MKGNTMEEDCKFRRWDELIPDALGLIFKNLSLQETLTVIPRVCKSWGKAVTGPYCWQEIDIEQWSQNCDPETLDRMLQMLIPRSSGSLRKLCVTGLRSDQSFSFIADHAKSLQTLRLPRSEISNKVVEQVAARLSTLTFLDISYCRNIGAPAIEAIGKHCKSLTGLRRTTRPLELFDELINQDDEALAIAATMPKLKHLEMAHLLINTESVLKILSSCPDLELLDVQGCWNVILDAKTVNKFSGLKVIGPHAIGCSKMNDGWDDCSDYSSSSRYLAWDFVASDYDYMSDGLWEDDQSSMEDGFENFDYDYDDFGWFPSP